MKILVRRCVLVLAGVALVAGAPIVAIAAWTASGSGLSSAAAASLNQPTAPTVSRGSGTVGLTWAASTTSSGVAASSYDVLRHQGSTVTVICSAVTTRSCTDASPLATAVSYGIRARAGSQWTSAESATTPFTYDNVAPVSTLSVSPAPNTAGWNKTNVSVTISATDSGSPAAGVTEIHYTLDGGTETVVKATTTTFAVSQELAHTVTYWAVDGAGNTETQRQGPVKVDKTTPVTTSTPMSSTTTWTKSGSVTLSATDALSGVSSILYKLDGAASYATYTGAISLSDGTHTIAYHAVDVAGNTESDTTGTYKIDTTLPTASVNPASGSYTSSVTITGSDATSGVASVQYNLDSAGFTTVAGSSATVNLSTSGAHTLQYRAVDNAGNVGTTVTASYTTDLQNPTVTAAGPGPANNASYTTANSGNDSWAKACTAGNYNAPCATAADDVAVAVASVTFTLKATSGQYAGKCWSGSTWIAGTSCSAPMSIVSGSASNGTWAATTAIANSSIAPGSGFTSAAYSIVYTVTDTAGKSTQTSAIQFTTK